MDVEAVRHSTEGVKVSRSMVSRILHKRYETIGDLLGTRIRRIGNGYNLADVLEIAGRKII